MLIQVIPHNYCWVISYPILQNLIYFQGFQTIEKKDLWNDIYLCRDW